MDQERGPFAPELLSQAEDPLPAWPCSACWEPTRPLRCDVGSAGLRGLSHQGHILLWSWRANICLWLSSHSSLHCCYFRHFCLPYGRGTPWGQDSLQGFASCPPASGVTHHITGPVAGLEPLRPPGSQATVSLDCPQATSRLCAWSPCRRGGGCSVARCGQVTPAHSRRAGKSQTSRGQVGGLRPDPGPGQEDRGPSDPVNERHAWPPRAQWLDEGQGH